MRPLPLSLVVLLVTASAPADDRAPAGDLTQLQGTWKASDGPKDLAITLEIKGRTLTISITSPQGELHTATAEVQLDGTARPKAMDWVKVVRDGQDAPDVRSIYELAGDTLKVRAGRRPDGERPTAFLAEAGAGDQVVFRRPPGGPPKDSP